MLLSLAYPEHSEIKYKTIKFPDGQQSLVIEPVEESDVVIESRLRNFMDLELIACAFSALNNSMKLKYIELRIPYMLGARSDRVFKHGGPHYLKDVIANFINSMSFDLVTVLDPHSEEIGWIENLCTDSQLLYRFILQVPFKNSWLIVPDEGATGRVLSAGAIWGVPDDRIVYCKKERDLSTGRILETVVPLQDFEGRDCYIVDDICDGGRTFIELAKILKARNCGKLFLVVTHGIFSKGFTELYDYFEHIYTTNSVQDFYAVQNANNEQMLSVFNVFRRKRSSNE